ncbi:hypothetical protein DFA_09616 [Cavenderia fasciculata]|uniref:ComC supersandwich domain-containing protein n=1 Tax=Cavenderia fasciculata TaxID=261658 RepID=F4Q845_CACFS|nr:uncharacterized protein DFA_09616 [Cavenderia fasciculata]EGG15945.1 hypothetical protein DFA_09616 [Cavenderia fasciculata]|eukprot:XP_004352270.1 hypothetical protein DFA_09616 [Cavenderia fasciculata]
MRMNCIIIKIIVPLLLLFSISHAQTQTLTQPELDSAIYLLKLYGQSAVPQDQTICQYSVSSTKITCDNNTSDGQYHIRQFTLQFSAFTNIGLPDPTLTSLYLPEITTFQIIKNANTINANTSVNLQTLTLEEYLKSFTIDRSTMYFPSLVTMGLYVSTSWDTPYLLNISSEAFPKLNSITINGDSNVTVYYHSSAPSTSITCTIFQKQCDLKISSGINISSLTVSGIVSLDPITATEYPNLTSFRVTSSQLTQFPFISYPARLSLIDVSLNQITSIPKNNMGFGGNLSQSYCSHRSFDIRNTSVESVPDCFWCYFSTVPAVLVTSLTIPNGFVCDVTLDNPTLGFYVTNQSIVTITGNNLGWGGSSPGYSFSVIKPNKIIAVSFSTTPNSLTPFTIKWATFTNAPQSTVSVIEAGIALYGLDSMPTYPEPTISLNFLTFNPQLNNSMTVDGSYACSFITPSIQTNCTVPSLSLGPHQLNISNPYLSRTIDFVYNYPTINSAAPVPFVQGSDITIKGDFGQQQQTSSSIVVFMNGDIELSQCTVKSISSSTIVCHLEQKLVDLVLQIRVGVNEYNSTYPLSDQELCQQSTINCHGNGQCNTTGLCVCNSNAFYNDCSKPYPIISSGSYDQTNNKIVNLFGDFGPFGQLNVIIKINNVSDCIVDSKSQQSITCTLEQTPNYGLSSVQLHLDSLDTNAKDILYLRQPDNGGNNGSTSGSTTTDSSTTTSTTSGSSTGTPQQQCEKQTSNCYGHGICGVNGICQCDKDYNPVDNCFTKFINSTIIPNTTSPTVSFDIDGIDFQFEVVSIQELDFDSNIVKELFISNYTWIVNASTNNITTVVDYQLNTTLSSSSSSDIVNNILFQSVSVLSTISFSTQSRDIQFGDQQLHINANSIKLSVNVTNWQYSSNLATLRVVFRTIIINNQTVEYDCNEKEIDPLTYDSLSSLQYLRVIKDDIQFNGRFIDVALSDGRPTYSQTQLISLTQSTSNEDESIALLGINLPQCQSCVLDPDFSPLLIDKSNDSGCGDGQSNNWRIIVGCVVGGAGAVAIATASIITYRKMKKAQNFDKSISNKLKNASRS